ncbi:oocyte zinc finger protein XlCOF7.1-like [Rana temporaria]|uniref:oocyte zinc finger protein XlCOF7.1-like n=1 Tax=Rana temporaria TaxID=8407 RepID=UPI001AACC5F0|nr:oocyte zinc finger protein XlCOF7.1-like [Rana temporaria]XP_040177061.1 oocyte zinc finger protein XlCOF7.1-like [Rana temporaria]
MEKDKMDVTRRFFSLTLEIIYLLTGEDFMVVRESGELISRRMNRIFSDGSNDSRGATVGLKPLAPPGGRNNDNVLKLTSKIVHLLTGEVRRFVGHEDGSNEDIIQGSQFAPPLDGSSNGNPPGRCRRPLYSRDSSEEEEGEEEDRSMEEDDHHGDNVISIKVEDEEDPLMRGGEKKRPLEISTDGSSNGNPPERRPLSSRDSTPRPLYSRDSTPRPLYSRDSTPRPLYSRDSTPRPLYSRDSTPRQAENPALVIVPQAQDGDDDAKGIGTSEVTPDHDGKNGSPQPETLGSRHSSAWSSDELVSPEGKIYVCYECGKCVVYDTDLQGAEAGARSALCCDCDKANPFKPFVCVKCGKSFSSKMVFMAHQSVHTGGQSFLCGECGLTFSNKSILETHRSIHTGDRPFSCSECGKCFAMKANLVKHLKVHKGEKPFPCQECGKRFGMKSNLVKHQRVHTGEKPFECAHCGKAFGMKSNLVKHQRIHTGEKPFECLECGKCFASRSNLTTHEKIHTGEKPFACCFCGKGFITSSDLSRHQKTHTGERPFMCADCGKTFISKSILTAHQKSHTGDEPALTFNVVPERLDSC